MSTAQIALDRLKPIYYASEIDKYAIKITQKNYPDTIQLGDITDWRSWDIPKPDLIIGGPPCQGFSRSGKGLNFDDPRSKLFFTFVDILKEYRPKYFIMENVLMKQEWQEIINTYLEVLPVRLNSNKVSAQDRKRLYWTNIPVMPLEDKGILLKDIIESGYVVRDKAYTIDANYYKGGTHQYQQSGRRMMVHDEKLRKLSVLECERLQTVPEGYTEGVSNTQRYKMLGNAFTVDIIAHILKKIDPHL
jgi:DNA (cytosine-5)-methyltransferase 3A